MYVYFDMFCMHRIPELTLSSTIQRQSVLRSRGDHCTLAGPSRYDLINFPGCSPSFALADMCCPEMPQNRHTVKARIYLNAEQCQKITNEGMRLLMYCGVPSTSLYNSLGIDIAFPNQIEVKVNDDDVKHNFKGLKNKPGTTKPADITSKIRTRPPSYENRVSVTYALTTKRYAYVVYLARHISPERLAERIRAHSVISKKSVLDELNRANADPDIETTSTRMSLKDPISTTRINLPVRSTVCTHNQCFDGGFFLQMMEQAPQWNCPICQKTVSFQSLCVDKYFEDILNHTPKWIEKVDVEPDGEWQIIKDEEEEPQTNGTSGKPRASYDDDFDDDLIEVPDPSNKPANGLRQESRQPSTIFSSMNAFSTPPLSSREPSIAQSAASGHRAGVGDKRQSSVMIDLTLSDDEDEPPRPAKRHQPASTSQNRGDSRGTSSLHNRFEFPRRQADNYRSSSHAGPPPPSPHGSQQPFGGSGQLSNTQSPTSSRYTPTPAWPAQGSAHSPPVQNGFQPFSIRPPHNASANGLSPSSPSTSGLRLPPMQPHPPSHFAQRPQQSHDQYSGFGGWRSDRDSQSYSHSPG